MDLEYCISNQNSLGLYLHQKLLLETHLNSYRTRY